MISNSVTEIGNYAFYGCTNLKNISIPNSVTIIGDNVFQNTALTSVSIGKNVVEIGSEAFYGCSGLTSITIPESVLDIGYDAFKYVNNIKISRNLSGSPWGAKTVNGYVDGDYVYEDSSKKVLTGCNSNATNFNIPNSVNKIGNDAFYGCLKLTNLIIPENVVSVGSGAFNNCSNVKELTMPCSTYIKSIDSKKISKVTLTKGTGKMVDYEPEWLVTIGDNRYYAHYSPWRYSRSALKEIILENGIKYIGAYAFEDCTAFSSIVIPSSVTSIGRYAFYNCTSLKDVYYSGTKAQYGSITIGTQNDRFINATVHFGTTPTVNYKVTYNANGGSVSPTSVTVESGKSVTLPTPTRSGHTCLGWATSSSATSATYKCGTSYMPNANVTLYAVWKADLTPSSVSASSSFTVDTRNTTSLKVKWSAVSGASGYQLQRKKTINGKLEWTDVANTTSTSYTINSLSAGTLYYLRVRTYKTVNGSKQYSSWKTLTTCTKPSTPSAPSVDTRATISLKIKWNAVNKATSYEIQRKKTVNGKLEWVSLGTTKNLNYTISSLAAGTCYYIRVRAIRTLDNGNKYYSDWSKTLTTCTKPSATANFKVDSRTTTSLKLKWDAVSKATSYEVQRKKTVDGKLVWVSLGTTTNKNFTISGLSAGTLYYVRVRAIRTLDNGNKYYSDWKNITTCTNPSAVKNLNVDSVQSNSVKLKWDKVSKATNYEVQQKKIVNGKATWVLLDIPTATSYNIKALSSKTTYNFRVRAFRKLDNGNKYFSEWKEITVKTK